MFIKENGELNSHKKWRLKNCKFVLKKKTDAEEYAQELSVQGFLALSNEDALHYKEVPILGKNTNPVISIEEYEALERNARRYYLTAEDVIERTERIKDTNGHFFVRHDLFNHDPELENPNPYHIYSQDGIAEAFAEFAKKEGLSFFQQARL